MFGTTIGKKAQALAAALAIGAAVLGFAPGEAQAAKKDDGTRCVRENDIDGTLDFYLPGESIWGGRYGMVCNSSGEWDHVYREPRVITRDHRTRR